MADEYTDIYIERQKRATCSLIKFCDDHNRDHPGRNNENPGHYYEDPELKEIRECLAALEAGNVAEAVKHYQEVSLGGNGCFNDWWPPVVYEHETREYVWSVFDALITSWSLNMRLSLPNKSDVETPDC